MALFTNRFFSFLFSRCVDGYNPVQFHDAKLGLLYENGAAAVDLVFRLLPCFLKPGRNPVSARSRQFGMQPDLLFDLRTRFR